MSLVRESGERMGKEGKQSYYEILDVSFNSNPEVIRTAYIRAKNAYSRDSLAAYSLFDREDSKRIIEEIEVAYSVLSDSEKRRKYDESHGIISSEDVYSSYHKGNYAVAAFARELHEQTNDSDRFQFEEDPFRKVQERPSAQPTTGISPSAPTSVAVGTNPVSGLASTPAPVTPSHIERLKALQNAGTPSNRSHPVSRAYETDPAMEEKIQKCESVTGSFLREIREYKKVSPEEIMDTLKISKNYLQALEEDAIAKLPANVFVRGFVIQYAKALKLEHDKYAAAYMTFLRSKRPG